MALKITRDWTTSEIDLLIKLVRTKADLYDQSRPGYSNLTVIENSWRAIAKRIPTKNAKLCKTKWQILRGSYRARRNAQDVSDTGRKVKKWAYFDSMLWLDKHLVERRTSSNTTSNSTMHNPIEDHFILTPDTSLFLPETEDYHGLDNNDEEDLTSNDQIDSGPVSPNSGTPSLKINQEPLFMEHSLLNYAENKKRTSIMCFLESLEEDMAKLSPKGLRKYKEEMLRSLGQFLEDEGKE